MNVRCFLFTAGIAVAAIALPPANAYAQITITGRVVSETGAPLPGTSVYIEGTYTLTTSGADGTYSLRVPESITGSAESITLLARRIAYRSASRNVDLTRGNQTADFSLVTNPLRLGEVIATGAGTMSAVEKLGHTINSIRLDQVVRSGEANLVTSLAGKVPNVQITTQSGDPGSSAFIRIRGPKTIAGTGQPLFVVDGMAIDNSTRNPKVNDPFGGFAGGVVAPNRALDINPDDIASIEVLKGAAAAAVYGARAGQGVVLITTKQGAPGPTRYSFSSSLSSDEVVRDYPLQQKYGLGAAFRSGGCTATNCTLSPGAGTSFGPLLSTPTFDHYGELFERGLQRSNALTVSGGDDRTRFYLSASEFDHQGPIVGGSDSYARRTIRLNGSHRASDAFTVGGNVAYADSRGEFVQKGSNPSGLLLAALRSPPDFNQLPYRDATSGMHRSYRFPNPGVSSTSMNRGYDNPFFIIDQFVNDGSTNRMVGNAFAEWQPVSWLSVREAMGADYGQTDQLIGTPKGASVFATGQVFRNTYNTNLLEHQLMATASFDLSSSASGTLGVGHGTTSRTFKQVWVQGDGLIADRPFKLSNTVQRQPPVDAEARVHTDGVLAHATVDLWQQLYLTGGMRYDGSSTFSEAHRYGWFPKAGAAWAFTPHLERLGVGRFISFGKVRAAYGEVGEAPHPYQLLPTLVAGGSFLDGGWISGIGATQGGIAAVFDSTTKGQADLRPERTTESEMGLDLGLFENRADVGVTYYYALSKDVILLLPLPPSTGFSRQVQNAARIRNKGWELTANVRPVMRGDLEWEVNAQWAQNDNVVLQLAEGVQFIDQNGGFGALPGTAFAGGRAAAFRGLDFARCGAANVAPQGVAAADFSAACAGAPNGALYIGANGFPVVDGTTRAVVDPQPVWTGSLNNSLRWKNVRISALLDHQQGGEVWNGTKGTLYAFGTHKDTEAGREGVWTFGECAESKPDCRVWMPGNEVVGPGAGREVALVDSAGFNWFMGSGGLFSPMVRQFVEKATYTKLREVSLSYTFERERVTRALGISGMVVRATGRNLALWSAYSGIDPETNTGGAEVPTQGVDFFNHPTTRSFVVSITLNR